MGEQDLHVGDAFERAEHDDDVRLRRSLSRKVAARDIADGSAVAPDAIAALIGAAVREQTLQGHRVAEIEHARAGQDELGGEFSTRIGLERDARREAYLQREIAFDVEGHSRRAESRYWNEHEPANQRD